MRFRIPFLLKTACGLGWCLLALCSSLVPLAGNDGSGTITGNPGIIVGKIVDSLNRPLKGAHVLLRKSDYLSPIPGATAAPAQYRYDTITDSLGRFSIGPVDTGSYLIEADSGRSYSTAFTCIVRGDGKTVDAGANILRKVCFVHGMVSPELLAGKQLYVQIYGLERTATVNMETGTYYFSDLPEGNYTLALSWGDLPVQLGGIEALSGETVSVSPYNAWLYSNKIALNTTATGAGVSNDVRNFPVLLRLTSRNFNFSQAKTNGNDIRFTNAHNVPLDYEIERWNLLKKQAEIWVSVDTIYGNNSSQSITMHWGNPDAGSASSGAGVFDSGKGFQAVWHLAENAPDSRIKDAMGRYDGVMMSGTREITSASVTGEGIVAGAVQFQGNAKSHWINLGADRPFLKDQKEITVSVWMSAAIDSQYDRQLIAISKGGTLDSISPESRAEIGIDSNKIVFHSRDLDNSDIQVTKTGRTFVSKQWYNITGVMKVPEDSLFIYVNGELWQLSTDSFDAPGTDLTNALMSAIGSNDNGKSDHFNGFIDEVRLETTARSPDWVKLCYMNQRQNDALVIFR